MALAAWSLWELWIPPAKSTGRPKVTAAIQTGGHCGTSRYPQTLKLKSAGSARIAHLMGGTAALRQSWFIWGVYPEVTVSWGLIWEWFSWCQIIWGSLVYGEKKPFSPQGFLQHRPDLQGKVWRTIFLWRLSWQRACCTSRRTRVWTIRAHFKVRPTTPALGRVATEGPAVLLACQSSFSELRPSEGAAPGE